MSLPGAQEARRGGSPPLEVGGAPLLANPAFLEVLGELSTRTDAVWLAGNAIGLGLTLVAAFVFPRFGLFFAYLAVAGRLALYAVIGASPGGTYFHRMLRLGLVAGVLEIFADYMLVHWLPTGRLVYLTHDKVFLESPLYMPFAWACVIVEFGYVPLRLYGLLRARVAAATAPLSIGAAAGAISALSGGVVAGASIGIYEFLAFRAGWWKYEPAKVMLGPYCAAYIPLGEFLMFLGALPTFAALVRHADTDRAAPTLWGSLFATLIFVSYSVAYVLLEVIL